MNVILNFAPFVPVFLRFGGPVVGFAEGPVWVVDQFGNSV
jgi:hypothetical protein